MHFEGITLYAVISELRDHILNGFVQKIHQPAPDLLVLQIYAGEKSKVLISSSADARAHLTSQSYENPPMPSAFCMLLRKYLEGGLVERVEQSGLERVLDLWIRRGGDFYLLRAELIGNRSNVILLKDSMILGALHLKRGTRSFLNHTNYESLQTQYKLNPFELSIEQLKVLVENNNGLTLVQLLSKNLDGVGQRTVKEMLRRANLDSERISGLLAANELELLVKVIEEFFDRLKTGQIAASLYWKEDEPVDCAPFEYQIYQELRCERFSSISGALDAAHQGREQEPIAKKLHQLQKHLNEQIKKIERARDQSTRDLEKAAKYEEVKESGDILMSHLQSLKKGQNEIELEDFSGKNRIIELDPTMSAVENAQRYYERYKKLKRGLEKITERLGELNLELEHLENLQVNLEQTETLDELRELQSELDLGEDFSPKSGKSSKKQSVTSTLSGPRKIVADGYSIFIGRNGRQNDALIREANREDLWFHAKDRPGAHVVLRTNRQQDVPERIVERAAELAAFYSKGRSSAHVPVLYTRVKYLKKPKGAKPGLVLISKEEGTLFVTPKGEE
ncbi:NFACT family protein [Candidatus Acetothermia bacterium]|nr:NFACT family protein [Candidatus Acetothermia bacterium]MBI3643239.1 NFACT family protein [Candidatus Acetothermia bacterium]